MSKHPYVWVATAFGAVCIAVFSIPPARAAIENAFSCAQSAPCLEWDNTGSGDAVKGVSTKGNALHGQTKYKSAGKTVGKAGVLGEDLSTSGNLDSGVLGVSTNGAGVTGTASAYNGVQGFSGGVGSGVYGQSSSASGFGVAGRNTATTHDNGGAGVLADGGAQNDALHAFANGPNDNAIYAFSASGLAATFVAATGNRNEAMDLYGGSTGNANASLVLFDSSATAQVIFDDIGNAYINGLLYSSGACHAGCLVGNKRVASVGEYGTVGTEPTIEDDGEAQLADGRAYVKLDTQFANVIDAASQYLVSVTPEGDCRGLYVAGRSPDGFTVRELEGGHANVAFEYRIVAKRFGVRAARLPFMGVHRGATPLHSSSKER